MFVLHPVKSFLQNAFAVVGVSSETSENEASFNMNLLIIEDNDKMRRMIRNIVADLAERIDECADGDEALSLYEAGQPDFVLMDIQMKNTNGIQTTREIVASYADARIMIVTNYNDETFRESAREAGAFAYVLKQNLLEVRRILEE